MFFCNCNTLQEPTGAVSPISSAKTADNTNEEERSANGKTGGQKKIETEILNKSYLQSVQTGTFLPRQDYCCARAFKTPAPWSCDVSSECFSFREFSASR